MKVFLSHSTKDGDFVAKLGMALETNGFETWRCETEIEKGANFVAKIDEGLTQSDLALLIWSKDSAVSAWILEEWTTALVRQVEENRIRLGVVLLGDCPMPLPPLLRTKNYIDARENEDLGIRETLKWLIARKRVQRWSGLHAPVYLPDYRPAALVGRTAYLTLLQNALNVEPGVFLLYGQPGAGKSTLALSFAWEVQKDFDAVIFQTCGRRPLDAITAELVERLPDVRSCPVTEQRAALRNWLCGRRSLLVLDDVWSADVRQLDPGPPCSVLYTSRHQSLPGVPSVRSAKVERFTDVESQELFHLYLDPIFGEAEVTKARESLLDFTRRVEGLPIAIAVSASLLREQPALSLKRAVEKLKIDALADGATDVSVLFQIAIESRPENEQRLLAGCAVCAREGLWLPLAVEISGISEGDAENAANRLVHASLLNVIDRGRMRFHLHSLMRNQVRALLGSDNLRLFQGRQVAAVEQLFDDWQLRHQDCDACVAEFVQALIYISDRRDEAHASALISRGYASGIRVLFGDDTIWAISKPFAAEAPEASRVALDDIEREALIKTLLPRLMSGTYEELLGELEGLS